MMGVKKKDTTDGGSLFDDLAMEIEKDPEPVDLQSKERTYQSKRNSKREVINGSAIIYDLREKLLSKAEFKNLSPDGVSFEISSVKIKPTDEVYVHFSSALNLGLVLCTVQWVTDIQGHRKGHKMIGLKFKKLTTIKQKKLDEFITELQRNRDRDPFYVG